MAFRRPRGRRSSRAEPLLSPPTIQESATATSWVGPFYFTRRRLVRLRNNVCSDVTFESQLLAVVERRRPIGKYRRAVTPLDFDSLVASINSGLKIESGASQ